MLKPHKDDGATDLIFDAWIGTTEDWGPCFCPLNLSVLV